MIQQKTEEEITKTQIETLIETLKIMVPQKNEGEITKTQIETLIEALPMIHAGTKTVAEILSNMNNNGSLKNEIPKNDIIKSWLRNADDNRKVARWIIRRIVINGFRFKIEEIFTESELSASPDL